MYRCNRTKQLGAEFALGRFPLVSNPWKERFRSPVYPYLEYIESIGGLHCEIRNKLRSGTMGNCAASTEKSLLGMTGNESRRNSAIDRKLQEQHELEKGTVKILLLGTGNSGKSTILKQFKLLHTGQGLGDPEPHKYVISSNVTKGITTLAQAARDLEQVKVDLQPENIKILEKMKELNVTNIWEEMETEDGQPQRVANLCKKLWQDPAVQEALKYEGQIAMLEVPIQYFMSNIDRIADENYVPSTEDILQARARTSGVVSIEFKIDDTECRMFDVGGQRNERKKWISHFDNVTAIMVSQ